MSHRNPLRGGKKGSSYGRAFVYKVKDTHLADARPDVNRDKPIDPYLPVKAVLGLFSVGSALSPWTLKPKQP
jgi:hypothetical protein